MSCRRKASAYAIARGYMRSQMPGASKQDVNREAQQIADQIRHTLPKTQETR